MVTLAHEDVQVAAAHKVILKFERSKLLLNTVNKAVKNSKNNKKNQIIKNKNKNLQNEKSNRKQYYIEGQVSEHVYLLQNTVYTLVKKNKTQKKIK